MERRRRVSFHGFERKGGTGGGYRQDRGRGTIARSHEEERTEEDDPRARNSFVDEGRKRSRTSLGRTFLSPSSLRVSSSASSRTCVEGCPMERGEGDEWWTLERLAWEDVSRTAIDGALHPLRSIALSKFGSVRDTRCSGRRRSILQARGPRPMDDDERSVRQRFVPNRSFVLPFESGHDPTFQHPS